MKKWMIAGTLTGIAILAAACNKKQNDTVIGFEQEVMETEPEANAKEDMTSEPAVSETEQDKTEPETYVIDGYTYVDGWAYDVKVTMQVENIQKGDEAYQELLKQDKSIPEPKENEEYIIVTFSLTYNDGEVEEISFAENIATQWDMNLRFLLMDMDNSFTEEQDSAEENVVQNDDMTSYLPNSIYNVVLSKNETKEGAVALLKRKGNTEPLRFFGFSKNVEFHIND